MIKRISFVTLNFITFENTSNFKSPESRKEMEYPRLVCEFQTFTHTKKNCIKKNF